MATPDIKDPSKVSSLINSEHIQSTNHTLEPHHKLSAVLTSGIFHPLKWPLPSIGDSQLSTCRLTAELSYPLPDYIFPY